MANQYSIEELRGKDSRELNYDLTTARKDLFHARLHMESEGGRPSDIANHKKTIARILTVLNQRENDEAEGVANQKGAKPEESVES